MKPYLFHSSFNANIILFIGILLLLLCNQSEARITTATELSKVNLYADFGFHFAGQASINLERQIYSGEKTTWYGRGGVGTAGIIMANGGFGALGAITMLTGKGNKHFEINGGTFIGKDTEHDEIFVYPLIDFGYRYQKPEGGFIFKAKLGFLGIGIGLGYAF
ncbi:hypothetical protein D1164_14415 [Mariniphaga sediminis]|uniref:DUF3575 domain-containing protein n=1 Tax=Mariniphaga sediminis TaxID=1628158 RepID=A0A399CZA3_9BACT|nr:hypothetical protein [Mariniphaga sediminis]RIH64546.1 hypothetical protein D1164_14415 [Mariniphaga sediminis]